MREDGCDAAGLLPLLPDSIPRTAMRRKKKKFLQSANNGRRGKGTMEREIEIVEEGEKEEEKRVL